MLHIEANERLILAFICAVVAVVALIFIGSKDAAVEEIIIRAIGAALIILAFPFVYVRRLVSIPAQRDGAQRIQIERLEIEKLPVLTLDFENTADYVTPTEVEFSNEGMIGNRNIVRGRAYFVRVRCINTGERIEPACRPFLNSVQVLTDKGWARTSYADPLTLIWSNKDHQQARQPTDLYPNIAQFIDVVSSNNQTKKLILETDPRPYRLDNLFKFPGIYRLEIIVFGQTARSDPYRLDIEWKGMWNDFDIGQELDGARTVPKS